MAFGASTSHKSPASLNRLFSADGSPRCIVAYFLQAASDSGRQLATHAQLVQTDDNDVAVETGTSVGDPLPSPVTTW